MALHPDFLRTAIAHRGLHGPGVPENSMAAFRAAIEAGYAIELDIQHSSDGTPIVFHDYDLTRMVGDEGYVADMDIDEILAERLLDTDEPIPKLVDVLREVAGQVPLLIEIKDQDGRLGPNVGTLQDRVAAVLETYEGPVAVMSFNPDTVAAFGLAAPGIARGLTSCAFAKKDWPMLDDVTRSHLAQLADLERAGASFISHDKHDLDNPAVTDAKARGLGILCWTVTSPEDEAKARKVAHTITFEHYRP